MYTNSSLQKVGECKVNLYELIQKEDDQKSRVQNCDSNTNDTDGNICIKDTEEIDGTDVNNYMNNADGTKDNVDCTEDIVD